MEIFPTVENILLVVAQTAQASQTWSDREDPDVSAMQDQWPAKPTTASAAPLNQIAVAGIVALLGVSYMFNSMDRQVFPALLSAIIPQYGLTLPQAGFVSTVFTVMVALFGTLSGWFMARFGRKPVLVGGVTPIGAGRPCVPNDLWPLHRGSFAIAGWKPRRLRHMRAALRDLSNSRDRHRLPCPSRGRDVLVEIPVLRRGIGLPSLMLSLGS